LQVADKKRGGWPELRVINAHDLRVAVRALSNLVEGSGGSQLRTKARVIRIRRDSPSLLLKVAHG